MITLAALQAEFETQDGLHVSVMLKVVDETGEADAVISEIFEGIQDYMNSQDGVL